MKRQKNLDNFEVLRNIADECFMPLSYGGGINSLGDAKKIFSGLCKLASFASNLKKFWWSTSEGYRSDLLPLVTCKK